MCPCSSARKARKAPNTFHTPLSQSFWHLCDSLILLPAAGLCGAPVIPSQVSCAPARCTMGVIPPVSENNFFCFGVPNSPHPRGGTFGYSWLTLPNFAQFSAIFARFCPLLATFCCILTTIGLYLTIIGHYCRSLLPSFRLVGLCPLQLQNNKSGHKWPNVAMV